MALGVTGNELRVASHLGVQALKSDHWIQIPALPLTGYVTLNKEVTGPSVPNGPFIFLFCKMGIREPTAQVW